jgi:hypothetical protein
MFDISYFQIQIKFLVVLARYSAMLSSSLNKWITNCVRIIRRKVINESVEVLYGIQLLFALFEPIYMSEVLFVINCNLLMEKISYVFHLMTLEYLFIVIAFIALYLASSV